MGATQLTLPNMLAGVLVWAILLTLFFLYVYRPLMAVMDKRRETIAKLVTEAEENRRQAEEVRAGNERVIGEAKEEARKILSLAKKSGDEQGKKIVAAVEAEISQKYKGALEDIERAKERAMEELTGQVAELVVAATAKLLQKNLDVQSQRQLIEEAIREAGRLQ